MKRFVWGSSLSLVVCLSTDGALAFPHVVHKGELLADIARRYYGSTELEHLLVAANGLDTKGASTILPGMRLEVPAPFFHRVTKGETWPDLAERFLGDPTRAEVFARENDSHAWLPPALEQEVMVPAILTYVAAEGDSLPSLAKRFWGDTNKSWELAAYNHREGVAVRAGEIVLIPIPSLVLTKEGRERARMDAPLEKGDHGAFVAQKRADEELSLVLSDVRGGRYIDVVARANRLLASSELRPDQRALLFKSLTTAYVALDARGAAIAACLSWRGLDPQPLEARWVSPKIRAVCPP